MNLISAKQRLIVALDFPEVNQAKNMVEQLGEEVVFYKIGLELLMSGKYFSFIDWLVKKNKNIFVDLKLHDIAATTSKAIKNLSNYSGISLATIHTSDKQTMQQVSENKGQIKIIAVTVLTNLNHSDLIDIGFSPATDLSELVLKRAKLANDCGLDGVVASGLEAKEIRRITNKNFLIVTPGIRPFTNKNDDQKRIVDVKTALKNGADYLVIGRPITEAKNPASQANYILKQIYNFVGC